MSWDCGECRERKLDGHRRCGINPPPSTFKHVTKQGLSFDRCPKAWLRDSAGWCIPLIADHRWLTQHNVMPRLGGKLDQDPRFVDAVNVLDTVVPRRPPWPGL